MKLKAYRHPGVSPNQGHDPDPDSGYDSPNTKPCLLAPLEVRSLAENSTIGLILILLQTYHDQRGERLKHGKWVRFHGPISRIQFSIAIEEGVGVGSS